MMLSLYWVHFFYTNLACPSEDTLWLFSEKQRMSHGRISGEFGNNIISLDFPPPREKKQQQTPADSKKDPQLPFGFHTVRTFSTIRFLGFNYLLLLYGEFPDGIDPVTASKITPKITPSFGNPNAVSPAWVPRPVCTSKSWKTNKSPTCYSKPEVASEFIDRRVFL